MKLTQDQQLVKQNVDNNNLDTNFNFTKDQYNELLKGRKSDISLQDIQDSFVFLSSKGYQIENIQQIEEHGVISKVNNPQKQQFIIRMIYCQDNQIDIYKSEFEEISQVNSKFVVKIINIFKHPKKNIIYSVENISIGESLIQFLINSKGNKQKELKETQKLNILKGIAQGYQTLFEKNIIVGNLNKADSIFISQNGDPILIGFGLMDTKFLYSKEINSQSLQKCQDHTLSNDFSDLQKLVQYCDQINLIKQIGSVPGESMKNRIQKLLIYIKNAK